MDRGRARAAVPRQVAGAGDEAPITGHVEPAGPRLTRRRFVAGTAVAGSGLAVGTYLRFGRAAAAQDPAAFTRAASITSWGFGIENPLAAARVEAFKQAYPSINLEIIPATDDRAILIAAASDTLPDLLWLDRFTIASWAARGVLAPIDDLIERDGFDTSRFYEAALRESTYDGELYGIPGGMDCRVLYLNLDQLTEAGIDPATIDTADWDLLTNLGRQLVVAEGDVVRRWGFDTKLQAGAIYPWGNAHGANFLAGYGSEVTYDNPQVVETLEWGVRTYDAQGGFQKYETLAASFQGDEQFARGLVAMTHYESWMMGIIARTVPDLNFRVLPMLRRDGGGITGMVGGRSWTIPAGARDRDAAWEFVKFLHDDETWLVGARAVKQARQAEGAIYIPSLTGSITADRLQIEQLYEPVAPAFDEAVRLFPEVLAASPNREIGESPVGNQLHAILHDRAVMPALRGEQLPEEALRAADGEAEAAIAEAGFLDE